MADSGPSGDEWREVALLPNRLEADVVRSLLESEGITVLLTGPLEESAYVIRMGPLAEVRVLVPASQFALAHALLEAKADDQAWSQGDGSSGLGSP